jgi:excisionase family DNA binding protein
MAYCVEDAALVMGLTRTAVYAMIKEGRLKSIREGRRRIIPRSAIQAYLDSNAA